MKEYRIKEIVTYDSGIKNDHFCYLDEMSGLMLVSTMGNFLVMEQDGKHKVRFAEDELSWAIAVRESEQDTDIIFGEIVVEKQIGTYWVELRHINLIDGLRKI